MCGVLCFCGLKASLASTLFIYDSNSDRLSRDEEVTGKKLLGKQQALVRHLRADKHYKINDIWIGGEGSTDQGFCLPVTANWFQEVVKAGKSYFDDPEQKGFRKVEKVWR